MVKIIFKYLFFDRLICCICNFVCEVGKTFKTIYFQPEKKIKKKIYIQKLEKFFFEKVIQS